MGTVDERFAALDLSTLGTQKPATITGTLIQGLPVIARTDGLWATQWLVEDADGFRVLGAATWETDFPEVIEFEQSMHANPTSVEAARPQIAKELGVADRAHPTVLDALLATPVGTTATSYLPSWTDGMLVAAYLDSTHPDVPTVEVFLGLALPHLMEIIPDLTTVHRNMQHQDEYASALRDAATACGVPEEAAARVMDAADFPGIQTQMWMVPNRNEWPGMATRFIQWWSSAGYPSPNTETFRRAWIDAQTRPTARP